jgi:DNA-binding MarR family transcriptional regulator
MNKFEMMLRYDLTSTEYKLWACLLEFSEKVDGGNLVYLIGDIRKEFCSKYGFNPSSVSNYLLRLERKELIKRQKQIINVITPN